MQRAPVSRHADTANSSPMKRTQWCLSASCRLLRCAVAGARYVTSVPGVPYKGPLPALANAEAVTASRLAAHIRAIASRPHNIEHYDELEKAACYIEARVEGARVSARAADLSGEWPCGPQHRSHDRAGAMRMQAAAPSCWARITIPTATPPARTTTAPERPLSSNSRVCSPISAARARRASGLCCSSTRSRHTSRPPIWAAIAMLELLAQRREPIIGMISLETLGCFSDQPGSQ